MPWPAAHVAAEFIWLVQQSSPLLRREADGSRKVVACHARPWHSLKTN